MAVAARRAGYPAMQLRQARHRYALQHYRLPGAFQFINQTSKCNSGCFPAAHINTRSPLTCASMPTRPAPAVIRRREWRVQQPVLAYDGLRQWMRRALLDRRCQVSSSDSLIPVAG